MIGMWVGLRGWGPGAGPERWKVDLGRSLVIGMHTEGESGRGLTLGLCIASASVPVASTTLNLPRFHSHLLPDD